MAARNPPEETAFRKMIEELLDRIIAVGFFTFSDLRDVISRNNLKLPDLADPQEFVRGDPLLRLDGRLKALLDGVYRPSEIYLRVLDQVTSLFFGTIFGRFLTRNILLPFGLADSSGYWTPLLAAVVSYTFFGLDAIGDELSSPFADSTNTMPLDAMARVVEINILESLGEKDLPESLKPKNFVLT